MVLDVRLTLMLLVGLVITLGGAWMFSSMVWGCGALCGALLAVFYCTRTKKS
jgi:4-hydroxybenzoate polyprenyltransferase